MAYKKTFVSGDKLLASELTDNFTELEPVSEYTSSTKGILTGADGVSSLATFQAVSDGAFKISIDGTERAISGLDFTSASDFDDVAEIIQTAVRTATNKTETVEYDTDHFIITSSKIGVGSAVLKATSPTSGTDISGNDTELYLDIGTNATETAGTTPTGNRVVKTGADGNGVIDGDFIENVNEYDAPIPAHLICGTAGALATLQAVSDGAFKISIDGTERAISGLDFTSASDFDDVAEIIQTAVRTATNKTETVEYDTDHFVISSADETATSAITILSTPSVGTDITGSSYLNGTTNGVIIVFYSGSIDTIVKTGADGKIDSSLGGCSYVDVFKITGNTTRTVNCGFRVKNILAISSAYSSDNAESKGYYRNGEQKSFWHTNGGVTEVANKLFSVNGFNTGIVNNITDTSFDIVITYSTRASIVALQIS